MKLKATPWQIAAYILLAVVAIAAGLIAQNARQKAGDTEMRVGTIDVRARQQAKQNRLALCAFGRLRESAFVSRQDYVDAHRRLRNIDCKTLLAGASPNAVLGAVLNKEVVGSGGGSNPSGQPGGSTPPPVAQTPGSGTSSGGGGNANTPNTVTQLLNQVTQTVHQTCTAVNSLGLIVQVAC